MGMSGTQLIRIAASSVHVSLEYQSKSDDVVPLLAANGIFPKIK